jgi:hypothetical protein
MTRFLASATLLLLACGDDSATPLGDAGARRDSGMIARDDGGGRDAGAPPDGAAPGDDAGSTDAGMRPDVLPGMNTTCETALDVPPGTTSPVQQIASGSTSPRVCEPAGDGPMLWYRTVAPAGASIELGATLLSFEDTIYPYMAVRRVTGCAPLTCEAIAGEFPANPTVVTLDNTAGAGPREFLYAITIEDAVSGSRSMGTFELTASE